MRPFPDVPFMRHAKLLSRTRSACVSITLLLDPTEKWLAKLSVFPMTSFLSPADLRIYDHGFLYSLPEQLPRTRSTGSATRPNGSAIVLTLETSSGVLTLPPIVKRHSCVQVTSPRKSSTLLEDTSRYGGWPRLSWNGENSTPKRFVESLRANLAIVSRSVLEWEPIIRRSVRNNAVALESTGE